MKKKIEIPKYLRDAWMMVVFVDGECVPIPSTSRVTEKLCISDFEEARERSWKYYRDKRGYQCVKLDLQKGIVQ